MGFIIVGSLTLMVTRTLPLTNLLTLVNHETNKAMAFVLNNPKIVSHALTGVHRNIPRYESINYSRSDPKLKSQSYQNEASTVAAKVRFDRLGVDGVGEDW